MDHLRAEANQLEAKGVQQIECAVTGSKVEGLYDLLQEAVAHLELPLSVDPSLPKRHKQVATATVSSLTAQRSKAIVPKPKGGVSV